MEFSVERDGQEVFGWRKWAIAIPVVLITALVVTAAIVFMLGLALTVVTVLLVAVPVVLILALIARVLFKRKSIVIERNG